MIHRSTKAVCLLALAIALLLAGCDGAQPREPRCKKGDVVVFKRSTTVDEPGGQRIVVPPGRWPVVGVRGPYGRDGAYYYVVRFAVTRWRLTGLIRDDQATCKPGVQQV